jgi:hypothetical protein
MALSTQNKWIIGITSSLGLALIAIATKKWWMPKKDTAVTTNKDVDGYYKERDANPPKTEEEALALATKYGITKEDIQKRIIEESLKNAPASTLGNPKFDRVRELWKSFAANPPKTKEEAEATAAKFGVTRQDIDDYNALQPTIKVKGIKTSAPM